jgi:hypothetical protein
MGQILVAFSEYMNFIRGAAVARDGKMVFADYKKRSWAFFFVV